MYNYNIFTHTPFPYGSSILLSQSLTNLQLKKPSFLIHQNDSPNIQIQKKVVYEQKDWDKLLLSPEMYERIQRIQNNPFLKSNRVYPKYMDLQKTKQQISKLQKQKYISPYRSSNNSYNHNVYHRSEIQGSGIKFTSSNIQQENDIVPVANKNSMILHNSIIKNLQITKDDKHQKQNTYSQRYENLRQAEKQSYYRQYSYQQTQKLPQENKHLNKYISYQEQNHKPASFGDPNIEINADVKSIINHLSDSPYQQTNANRQQKEKVVTSQVEQVIINPYLHTLPKIEQGKLKDKTVPTMKIQNRNNKAPEVIEVRKQRYYLVQLV